MSWSLDNWGAARVEAADRFLSTGVVGTSFGGTGCFGSNTCAVGYACIGGRCVKTEGAGGGTGGSYGGSSGGGGYYAGGSCGSGPDSYVPGGGPIGGGSCATSSGGGGGPVGCTVPTCGDSNSGYGGFDSDCCGDRCCRYQAGVGGYPTVNCYCGNCPGLTGARCSSDTDCLSGVCINGRCADLKKCVSFCYEYYEANGSLAAGCHSDDVCDECTECGGTSAGGDYCTQKADAPPCHCDPDSVGDCDLCANDGSVIPGVCLECAEVVNKPCSCGLVASAKVCVEQGSSGLSAVNLAQDAAAKTCTEACSGPTSPPDPCCSGPTSPPDPCTPVVRSQTRCTEGANCNNGGPALPANEDGRENVWTGCIDNGTEACVLYNELDYRDLPDECKGCDCNCHNDCPDCQLCGADCKCYNDPACSNCADGELPCNSTDGCCPANAICVNGVCKTSITVNVPSTLYSAYYDCGQCEGTLLWVQESSSTVTSTTMTASDYKTAQVDCGNLGNDCETSCQMVTAANKRWQLPGWETVVNCDPAGTPGSGNFDCPDSVKQPCNAWERPDLRYYSSSGRLYGSAYLT